VRLREAKEHDTVVADLKIASTQGEVVTEVEGLRLKRVATGALEGEALSKALYRVGWPVSELDASSSIASLPVGNWVVVTAEEDGFGRALVERIQGYGRNCVRVDVGQLEGVLPADHVVCVWGRTTETEDRAAKALSVAADGLSVVQSLVRQDNPPRLWWVTSGVVPIASTAKAVDVACASLWGLGRTVMEEHPELGCTLVDVEGGGEGVEALIQEFAAESDENQVAWRDGHRHVARIEPAETPSGMAKELRTDGTVVIAGGLGTRGLHVARWLAGRGVRHLVLIGRRGEETPGAGEAAAELERLGARVTIAAVDVTNREELAAVLSHIPTALPLRGVVHAVMVSDPSVLTLQNAKRFASVMSPKVRGAENLDALTREADLDFFVLFSSLAGIVGAVGSGTGGFPAANAYLDALAVQRRAIGLTGQSFAWGTWTNETPAERQPSRVSSIQALSPSHRLRNVGIRTLSPSQGVALLENAVGHAEPLLLPLVFDTKALRKSFSDEVPPLWRTLVERRGRGAQTTGSRWAEELREFAPREREEAVRKMVRAEVARVLSIGSGEWVAKDRPLKELGLDSLRAVELRNALGKRVGKTLSATLAFDYPTATSITTYLLEKVFDFGERSTADKLRSSEQHDLERLSRLSEEETIAQFGEEFKLLLKDL
jgi:acyl carrier protein